MPATDTYHSIAVRTASESLPSVHNIDGNDYLVFVMPINPKTEKMSGGPNGEWIKETLVPNIGWTGKKTVRHCFPIDCYGDWDVLVEVSKPREAKRAPVERVPSNIDPDNLG
jgi:hypothetical protein